MLFHLQERIEASQCDHHQCSARREATRRNKTRRMQKDLLPNGLRVREYLEDIDISKSLLEHKMHVRLQMLQHYESGELKLRRQPLEN